MTTKADGGGIRGPQKVATRAEAVQIAQEVGAKLLATYDETRTKELGRLVDRALRAQDGRIAGLEYRIEGLRSELAATRELAAMLELAAMPEPEEKEGRDWKGKAAVAGGVVADILWRRWRK